jgi:hypothetical protein
MSFLFPLWIVGTCNSNYDWGLKDRKSKDRIKRSKLFLQKSPSYQNYLLCICGYLQNCSRDRKGPRDLRGLG